MIQLSSQRWATLAAAFGIGLGVWLVMRFVAPAAGALVIGLVALAPLACCAALAFAFDQKGLERFVWLIVGCAVAVLLVCAVVRDPTQMLPIFGWSSIAIMAGAGYSLAKAASWRSVLTRPGNWLLGCAVVAVLGLYCFYYVTTSRDLMFWDFMHYRVMSMLVASVLDQGQFVALLKLFAVSSKDEYSLLPALGPGLVLEATSPLSRGCYQAAIVAFYAAPAYVALGVLARDIARRVGPKRSKAAGPWAALAIATCAAFAAYPTGMAVAARGMPDIGGLVLVVASLRLCDRLARLLALPRGHEAKVGRLVRRVSLALALCLYGMFLFRRWYLFAAAGVVFMLALEVAILAVAKRAEFRWRETTNAAALGALTLFALAAPVLIDWLPNPGRHDYVAIYVAYQKDLSSLIAEVFDWYGAALLIAAAGCTVFLSLRSTDGRLLRMTCGASLMASLLFLHVQSPATHHAYLLTPAFASTIAAAILVLFERKKLGALVVLAALAGFTLTPAVSGWAPPGLAPTAGQPPAPRSDLAELARLRAWYEVNATPSHRVCVMASSYTINDGLVRDLWQIHPTGWPIITDPAQKRDLAMLHVDTRDGPPRQNLEECAAVLVGDPIQTHLNPVYQQTAILPAREMLAGVGIGANYRRTGEVFNLEKGVKLVAFDRMRPLTDADIAELDARWRDASDRSVAGIRGAIAQ
jgi:hypothetical protein